MLWEEGGRVEVTEKSLHSVHPSNPCLLRSTASEGVQQVKNNFGITLKLKGFLLDLIPAS